MFKKLFYFIFGEPCSFQIQCKKEESEEYRLKQNGDCMVIADQVWRYPMNAADKYTEPSFIYISYVTANIATYKKDKKDSQVFHIHIEDLKKDFLICSN